MAHPLWRDHPGCGGVLILVLKKPMQLIQKRLMIHKVSISCCLSTPDTGAKRQVFSENAAAMVYRKKM
ncbi:hypothetical protein E2C01_067101 [Portunus trituberculatus]|uniref:Uncharacterized protein n=1 Tax=Portunus trituberculatus TaxID=210409 RepID=A0A5B7HVN7_PORTR|nr:hypothetical protein [Portunus trituberculatus]